MVIYPIWRKRLALLGQRLYLYPPPEPMPQTRVFWLASGLVALAVIFFCAYFITLFTTRHAAFLTSAEDLGIIDQALWNTLHGQPLHQTICDIVTDSNCVGPAGISRFAIHFEPLLFPIALLYLFWPAPQTLLIFQTLVVALGAFPAFWLARLRLRSDLAGVAIAILYLLSPAQQQALGFDFHAVTLTASLLLFLLYFLYTRRTLCIFLFALLAMACKEEIPLVVATFGLWSLLLQRNWRTGSILIALALLWFILAFWVVMPHFSPTGKPLLVSRYAQLGTPTHFVASVIRHPSNFLQTYVFEHYHLKYLSILLSPLCYLPLLAPWTFVLAVPSIALNLLSSDFNMFSGSYQYNAEIVPVLIFSTIEALVFLAWIGRRVATRLTLLAQGIQHQGSREVFQWPRWSGRALSTCAFISICSAMVFNTLQIDYTFNGQMPFALGFQWPQTTAHTALAQRFLAQIPPDASVSAQTKLVPHLSHRKEVYLFPYADEQVDYIFLDVTADVFPFQEPQYISEVRRVLFNGHYGIVAAQDGYLLLKRGLPGPGISPFSALSSEEGTDPGLILPNLPASFCSNIYAPTNAVPHPLQVDVAGSDGGKMSLVGFDIAAPNPFSRDSHLLTLTTYWRVSSPITTPLQLLLFVQGRDGRAYPIGTTFPQFSWCQSNTWKPGALIRITGVPVGLATTGVPKGLAHLSIALLPLTHTSGTIGDVQAQLPFQSVHTTGSVALAEGTRALQLMPLSIVD